MGKEEIVRLQERLMEAEKERDLYAAQLLVARFKSESFKAKVAGAPKVTLHRTHGQLFVKQRNTDLPLWDCEVYVVPVEDVH